MTLNKTYRIFIYLIVLLVMFSGCSKEDKQTEEKTYCQQLKEQEINDNYEYPVVPGTNEWKAFESNTEMIDACQIPENKLTNMCTHGLIVTCLNYPLRVDIFAFNIPQMGYESQRNSFNGLAELHNRQDVLPELMEFYVSFDLQNIVDLWDQDDKFKSIDNNINFSLSGMMLYQNDIIGQANEEELLNLVAIALNKHELMRANDHISWYHSHYSNTTIMARAMLLSNFQPLKQIITEDNFLGQLIEGGFNHATSAQIDKIVECANQFVNGY